MVMGTSNKTRGLLSIFLPSNEYLPSFIEENHDVLAKLANEADPRHATQIVYHSMPLSCLTDPIFQSEVIERFRNAKHLLDCPDTNSVETNKLLSLTFARQMQQISPGLITIGP